MAKATILSWWERYIIRFFSKIGVPSHVAIIMDGNRRYAKKQSKFSTIIEGHKDGLSKLQYICEVCAELGIKYVTVYAFSLANFRRSEKEQKDLFTLAINGFNSIGENTFKDIILANDIQIRISGDTSFLEDYLRNKFEDITKETRQCKRVILTLCVAYGGRHEIYEAMKKLQNDNLNEYINSPSSTVCSDKQSKDNDNLNSSFTAEYLTENSGTNNYDPYFLQQYLYCPDIPPPDLLIRTSGENRLSDFLIYQCSEKTSFRFIKKLWPELSLFDFLMTIFHFRIFG